MATRTWEVFRNVTTPVAAAFVVVGLSSGILLAWSTRRSIYRHIAECECRWIAHRLWTVDRNRAEGMLDPTKEP